MKGEEGHGGTVRPGMGERVWEGGRTINSGVQSPPLPASTPRLLAATACFTSVVSSRYCHKHGQMHNCLDN